MKTLLRETVKEENLKRIKDKKEECYMASTLIECKFYKNNKDVLVSYI